MGRCEKSSEKLDPRNVSFYKQMDASSFMHHMSLPRVFTAKYGGHIGKIVKLKGPSGNIWKVGVTKRAEKYVLQFGWKEFIFANDIKENDVLIFNYNINSSFHVVIFKPNGCERISSYFTKKEGTNLQNSSDCSIRNINGPKRNIRQHEIITSGSSSDSENCTEQSVTSDEKPRQWSKKGASTSRNKNGGDKGEMPHNDPSFMHLPFKLNLTNAQNMKALQLAREVEPGNPYFVGIVNLVCMKSFTQSIPTKFCAAYLPTETQDAKLYYKGRIWNPMYLYSKDRKHIGSSGWRSFVIENNLEEGDILLFELLMNKNETISFKVHLSKN